MIQDIAKIIGHELRAIRFQRNYEIYVEEASTALRSYVPQNPEFAITLGSGLGSLADQIQNKIVIPYGDIPHFPKTSVKGHKGNIVAGTLQDVPIIGLQGRIHYYEVADQPRNVGILKCVFPIHVMASLGAKNYFVTNAAGGLNQEYSVGDVMLITSHLSDKIPNPLLGRKHAFTRVDGEPTSRFQPMHDAYDTDLTNMLFDAASEFSQGVHFGRYIASSGPTYESMAECVAFRDGLFVDAAGMSTVPEVIVARNRGMQVVGMSCITNSISDDGTNNTDHKEVVDALDDKDTQERLNTMLLRFFDKYKESI